MKEGKNYEDYTSVTKFTEDASKLLFESYEIFDELHREELNRKIVDHYLFDEIALTPYSKWQFILNRRMREIMPYYNKLYLTNLGIDEIYDNIDYSETLDRSVGTDTETNTNRSSTSAGTRFEDDSTQKDAATNTAQSETLETLSESDGAKSDVPFNVTDNMEYPSEMEKSTDHVEGSNTYQADVTEQESRVNLREVETTDENVGTSSSLLDSKTLEVYTKHMIGKNSGISKPEILRQYRETLLNIDMLIINELADLFMFMLN